jgi:hypothetical protein
MIFSQGKKLLFFLVCVDFPVTFQEIFLRHNFKLKKGRF